MKFDCFQYLSNSSILICCLFASTTNAQVIPDKTLPQNSQVTRQDNNIVINGGTRAENNLFHSFEQFSVSEVETAFFDNALDVKNILSRVTGNSISDIQGIIKTRGAANLFLVNPNGIIFGDNASLQIGGSFIATTANGILFPDGEFSATNLDSPPLITINAPIGLNFRDNPQPIRNLSFFTDESGNDLIGLRVPENRTIGLIGGDIFIDGGFVTTPGGRIELGSVGENSVVNLTEVDKGWDFSYEGVENFGDIDLSIAAFIYNFGVNTGDIEVQGRNINLIEGSQIGIDTDTEGQAGNLKVIATETILLDGNGIQAEIDDFPTLIFSNVFGEATGEGSQIQLETPQLSITNGAQITATNSGSGKGLDIVINASDIVIETPFIEEEFNIFQNAAILAEVDTESTGDGINITIDTKTLTLNEGAQIVTRTLGVGNAGNLTVNASESIELTGTTPNSNDPSGLFANVGQVDTATGNGGDLTVTTPRLVILDGAQIGTTAQNSGNGGNLTISASEVFISGTSPLAEFRGEGRSGIFVDAEPLLTDSDTGEPILDDAGNPFVTVGNGGTLNLTANELIVEKGAIISADNFGRGRGGNANINVNNLIVRNGGEIGAGSLLGIDPIDDRRGVGGTLTINASDSIEVTGIGEIGDQVVKSSLFTLAEGTGDAGDLTLTTNKLTVSDGGEINASATGTGAAGDLTITANSLDLNQGTLTAATAAGTGGNINLDIDDTITLENNSLISAAATGTANGGNININTDFIIATPDRNSDILASAGQQGTGGRIVIDAEGIFGIEVRPQNSVTNDIDASGGVDGEVIINTPDVDISKGVIETPQNVIALEQIVAQACSAEGIARGGSNLIVSGKGGVPPLPTAPISSDKIYIEGESVNSQTEAVEKKFQADITDKEKEEKRDIVTLVESSEPLSIDDIIPARGAIILENGDVILTAYPTPNSGHRSAHSKAKCSL